MRRLSTVLVAAGIVGSTLLWASAQSGIPVEIQGYRTWTRMNANLLTDLSNPRAGPKNTFVNLSPDELREFIGPGERVRKPFPDGAILVRETLDPDAGLERVLFIMRKDSQAAPPTRGWVFGAFPRTAADRPFQPIGIPDPGLRCLACHAQVKASDNVCTPFTNRPDRLPGRIPSAPTRVEIFNYQFGPQTLRVRPSDAECLTR